MTQNSHFLSNKYSFRIVDKTHDLNYFEEAWNKLAIHCGPRIPFLCFDWFKRWIEHFLDNDMLFVVLIYESNQIVCIAPLLKKQVSFKGILVNKVELIGNVYSPFRSFLFRTTDSYQISKYLSLVFAVFSQYFRHWDILDFPAIQVENGFFDILKGATVRTGLSNLEYFDFYDWYLDGIATSGKGFLESLPKKIKKDISYCRRRLNKTGNLKFKLVKEQTLVDTYMSHYYYVYSKSWQKKEGIGPTFHRALAESASKNGWLRLGFLFFEGAPISSQFWIVCDYYAYILKTVYHHKFRKYSPGKVLTADMMKYVIDVDRVTSVDYVQGDEPYKKDWTPLRRERKGILVFRNNPKGRYLSLLTKQILPVINKQDFLRKSKEILKSLAYKKRTN